MDSDRRSNPSPQRSNQDASSPKMSPNRMGPSGQKAALRSEDMGKLVRRAIKGLKDSKGSTKRDIKKYIFDKWGIDVKSQSDEISRWIKENVKSGHLVKEDGKYKVGAAAKKKRSAKSPGKSSLHKKKRSSIQKRKSVGKSQSPTRKRSSKTDY